MKTIKNATIPLFLLVIMGSFSQCAGSKKLQEEAPVAIEEIYFYKWVAGIQGGGSGINFYVVLKEPKIALDSVFFRGQVAKLEADVENNEHYSASFNTSDNQLNEMVMHKDPSKEYGNSLPKQEATSTFPFELGAYECVLSYKQDNTTKYFKIEKVVEKQGMDRPGMPENKQ